jgi:hypothetical protein
MGLLSGPEQLVVSMLEKMGINPEQIKAMAQGVQQIAIDSGERLKRIEESNARIEGLCEAILDKLSPVDGGFVLGDGSLASDLVEGNLTLEKVEFLEQLRRRNYGE